MLSEVLVVEGIKEDEMMMKANCKKKKKGMEVKEFLQVPMKQSQINRVSKHFGLLYRHLDEVMLDAETTRSISCKKGCSACCKQAVTISVPEAIALIAPIISSDTRTKYYFDVTYLKVKEQSQGCVSGKVNVQSWFEQEIPCVFLHNDLCTVYRTRPSVCRVHAVMTPPDRCSPPRNEVVSKVDIVNWFSATESVVRRVSRETRITAQIAPLPVAVMWATIAIKGGVDCLQRELGVHPVFSNDDLAAMWWGVRFTDKIQWEKKYYRDNEYVDRSKVES